MKSQIKQLSFSVAILASFLTSSALAQRPRLQQADAGAQQAEAKSSAKKKKAANQYIEVRTYSLVDAAAEARLDAYLGEALIPALERQGLGPIGALQQAGPSDSIEVKLIIPGPTLESVTLASSKLASDETYQASAKEYLDTPSKQTPIKRIRSELLLAFDCWPQVTVPSQKKDNKPRYFELRSYESATEKLGERKVEMFNEGEVPIFLDAGIIPVFMGQALIGDMMPNLTYMVAFDDEESMLAAWPKFGAHPDWKTLKDNPRYANTVSKNNKSFWVAKPYSQL